MFLQPCNEICMDVHIPCYHLTLCSAECGHLIAKATYSKGQCLCICAQANAHDWKMCFKLIGFVSQGGTDASCNRKWMSVNHYAVLLSVLIQLPDTINAVSSEALDPFSWRFFLSIPQLLHDAIQQFAKRTLSIVLHLSAVSPVTMHLLTLNYSFMYSVALPFPDILKH